jgi:hypothetical protein
MNGYYEAYLVCEGALDEERTFADYDEAIEWLEAEAERARNAGFQLEGYILEHWHPEDWPGECECSQYALDHRPVVASHDEAWTQL